MPTSPSIFCLCAALALGACATPAQVDRRLAAWQDERGEEIEALKRAVEASYDRERAMAERLRQSEEATAQLRQQLRALRDETRMLRSRLDSLHTSALRPAAGRHRGGGAGDALSLYQRALAAYNDRQYAAAAAQFDLVIAAAPHGEWADNAQYWKGECYYGLGKYRQALAEFTKVFAFSKTEKADDAQLKIGRCHLALGEREQAMRAFRKLLEEYPRSEYAPMARKELKYLGAL